MNIIKNRINEYVSELVLEDDNGSKFIMHYAGGDLYWTMVDYYDNNIFCINKNDEVLFSHMKNLFCDIENNDNPNKKILNNNCFEWVSEAYGNLKDANKLTITRNNDKFIINFFKNPNNKFNINSVCSVCFCLSGSKNQNIANAFSIMFNNYINCDFPKTKVLKN